MLMIAQSNPGLMCHQTLRSPLRVDAQGHSPQIPHIGQECGDRILPEVNTLCLLAEWYNVWMPIEASIVHRLPLDGNE